MCCKLSKNKKHPISKLKSSQELNTNRLQTHRVFLSLNNNQNSGIEQMQAEGENQQVGSVQADSQKVNDSKKHEQDYKIQLTAKELTVLSKCLPAGYSLQFQSKIQSRSSGVGATKTPRSTLAKKKSVDSRLLNENDQIESDLNRMPSIRSKKSANIKYNDQISEGTFPKYSTGYPPVETNRRNGYEGLDESLKPCVKILNLLKNSKTSWAFREPVDAIGLGIPQYLEIIKEPMDLSKIQNNLRNGLYATPTQFHADINKIVRNSYAFNQGNPEFMRVTEDFEQYYFKIIAEPNLDHRAMNSLTQSAKVPKPSTQSISSNQNKKRKPQRPIYNESISLAEKKQLSINIRKLPRQHMKGIVDIVRQEGDNKIKDQFDLEDLKPETIRQLQTYVRSKLMEPVQKANENRANQQNREGNDESEDFQIQSQDES